MSNILIITPYFRPAKCGGGGQVSIENLADLLLRQNSVSVICYNHDFRSRKKLSPEIHYRSNNFEVFYFSVADLFKIIRLIKRVHYDYIYFNSFFSPICIFFQFYFAFSNSIKIISPKGEFYQGAFDVKSTRKKLWVKVYKFFFKRPNFHATSRHEEPIIKEKFFNSSISVASDIPSLANYPDRIKCHSNSPLKMVFMSRIDSKKNLAFVPDILSQVTFDVALDIWGDIGDQQYFEECMIKFQSLGKNITWKYRGRLDFRESKLVFLNYDLFLFPTKGENYGHVIFESLSCGCPVLLSKDTTPWNDLDTFNAGYNVSLSNTHEWATKISLVNFYTDEQKALMSKSCKNYVRNKYDVALIEKENFNLFKIQNVSK